MNGLHVLLTGASSGIGEAMAEGFASKGARLTLVARRKERLEALARRLPVQTNVVVHDLGDPSRSHEVIESARAALGPIDILVNNAGYQVVGRTHEVDVAAADASVAVNLLTPLRLVHGVLPEMLARNSGTIVNIASMAALAPTPGMTWYNASKAGLAAASEALRGELRDTDVRVVTVYPGIIPDTAMAKAALDKYGGETFVVRLQPTGTPEGLTIQILAAITRGRARVIWPRANTLARHFPGLTRWLMDTMSPLPAAS